MRIYLAGPDVFLPDPMARAARLKTICADHGLIGVFPLDDLENEPSAWAKLPEPLRIARRNEAHIASCEALVANLTPFRGPSADVGTVFEMGFMRALARPVFGWTNHAESFAARTRRFAAVDGAIDAGGMQIEDFVIAEKGMADNLMIEGAILGSGGMLAIADCAEHERWTRLDAFDRCLSDLRKACAQHAK